MRVGLMQPYFFPYIGYLQLIAACDRFVVFDDAQFVKRGWVNRNRILVGSEARWITMPVAAASSSLPILRRKYLLGDRLANRLPSRIAGAYRGAPRFKATMSLVEEILTFSDPNVASFNVNLLCRIAAYLDIETAIQRSSEINKDNSLVGGENRVLDICKRLGAKTYINPIGGRELYTREAFAQQGIELRFLTCAAEPYSQRASDFVPFLSIIDVLMFNDVAAVRRMLSQYRLEDGV
jgi:hypothetical protein